LGLFTVDAKDAGVERRALLESMDPTRSSRGIRFRGAQASAARRVDDGREAKSNGTMDQSRFYRARPTK